MKIIDIFGITQAGHYANELEAVKRGERTLGDKPTGKTIEIKVSQDGGSSANFSLSGGDAFSINAIWADVQALLAKYKDGLREEMSAWLAHAEGQEDGGHHTFHDEPAYQAEDADDIGEALAAGNAQYAGALQKMTD